MEVLSRYWDTEETTKNLSQDNLYSARDFNPVSTEQKPGTLALDQTAMQILVTARNQTGRRSGHQTRDLRPVQKRRLFTVNCRTLTSVRQGLPFLLFSVTDVLP
jgi:hypothetical protein